MSQAKKDFERAEKKKEEARLRGEDTWMLPSVTSRLEEKVWPIVLSYHDVMSDCHNGYVISFRDWKFELIASK